MIYISLVSTNRYKGRSSVRHICAAAHERAPYSKKVLSHQQNTGPFYLLKLGKETASGFGHHRACNHLHMIVVKSFADQLRPMVRQYTVSISGQNNICFCGEYAGS